MPIIYGLRAKGEEKIRYVGQTDTPSTRLSHHIIDVPKGKNDDNPKRLWIQNVVSTGGEIVMDVLEECEPSEADARELHWIMTLLADGHELTNSELITEAHFQLYVRSLYKNGQPIIDGVTEKMEKLLAEQRSMLIAICERLGISVQEVLARFAD